MNRPAFEIAEEIGQAIMDAADKLVTFAPGLEAKVPFELDDTAFEAVIRMKGSSND
jgi:hypothetical protein